MAKGIKTGGRKAGTPNSATKTVKQTFAETFEMMQKKQYANLLAWGEANPTEFYRLASKLIPIANEHSGPDGGEIKLSATETAAKIAAILKAAQARKDKEEK